MFQNFPVFDDTNGLGAVRISGELFAKIKERATLSSSVEKITNSGEIMTLLRQLTGLKRPPVVPPSPTDLEPTPSTRTTNAKRETSQFYEFNPNRKPAQRKRENAAAMDILRQIDAGEIDPDALADDQCAALAKYSGTGGSLVGADGKKGSAYEYYTPKPIAEGVWSLLGELGFSGGKILDPCAGVGIFGATAPANTAVDSVELNETSGRVNELVNGGVGRKTTIAPFEKVAANTPDEIYDAVVTNVPFGGVADRGGNQLHDPKYQKEPLQNTLSCDHSKS